MNGHKLETLLQIDYPIIQGGMARVATAELAAAVSNAGGLGLIGSGSMGPETLRKEIEKCKGLTAKPFGVNLMLMNPRCDALVEVILSERIPVITTGAGNPAKYIAAFHEQGAKVIPVVALPSHAKRMERLGVDAIIAEGSEAGGHIGELTTMVLLPQVVKAVSCPVIAAGGLAEGSQVAAVLQLGASGVQLGTFFLAAAECLVHEAYKKAILKAKSADNIAVGRISGYPTRLIKNNMTREYLALEKSGASKEELELLTLGRLKEAAINGDVENGAIMAGQCVGQVNQIKPAEELISELWQQTLFSLQACAQEWRMEV